jgi:hypothetical protein
VCVSAAGLEHVTSKLHLAQLAAAQGLDFVPTTVVPPAAHQVRHSLLTCPHLPPHRGLSTNLLDSTAATASRDGVTYYEKIVHFVSRLPPLTALLTARCNFAVGVAVCIAKYRKETAGPPDDSIRRRHSRLGIVRH